MSRHTRVASQRSITMMIAIAGLVGACTTGSSPATTVSPASNVTPAPVASGAPTPAPTSTAAATAGSTNGSTGGTCKYLADSDVAAMFPNPGPVKLTGADTPAGTVTSCHWGPGSLALRANVVQLVVDDFKLDVALVAAKKSLTANVTAPIAGLGDFGGFSTQEADIISIEFYKGTRTAILAVAVPGMTPAAVAALAQKVAANL